MLSRVAGNIYWLGRYLERAEDMARLINVNANLALDLPKGLSPIWGQLLAITGASDDFPEDVGERQVLRYLISDSGSNTVSIIASLAYARENARTIRDVIPRESWETLNSVYLQAKDRSQQALTKRGRYPFLQSVITECQKIAGILSGTMNHDDGYTFLKLGRSLERGDMTSRIIDIRSENLIPDATTNRTTFENLQWMSVLRSLTGYQMYRREMQVSIKREDVLRFLIQSPKFPRAIARCLYELSFSLETLPNHKSVEEIVKRIEKQLKKMDYKRLEQGELQNAMDMLQIGFAQIHNELSLTYFGVDAAEEQKQRVA